MTARVLVVGAVNVDVVVSTDELPGPGQSRRRRQRGALRRRHGSEPGGRCRTCRCEFQWRSNHSAIDREG